MVLADGIITLLTKCFVDTVDDDDAEQDVNAILPKKQKFKKEEGKENRGGRAVRIPVQDRAG